MKERSAFFDNAKILLILLVVSGHAMELFNGHIISTLYKLIYLFHMPAFCFIVGYFSKKIRPSQIGALFFQYMLFQTLYILFTVFVLGNENTHMQYTTPYWLLWFSLAPIIWKLSSPIFANIKPSAAIILSSVFALAAGFDNTIGYNASLSRIIVFFPFFLAGYYFTEKHAECLNHTAAKIKLFLIPSSLLVFIISFIVLYFQTNLKNNYFYHAASYSSTGTNIFIRAIIMMWGAVLTFCFFALVPKRKLFITQMGSRTIQAYLLHGFAIRLLQKYNVASYASLAPQKLLFFFAVLCFTVLLLTKPIQLIFAPLSDPAKFIIKIKNKASVRKKNTTG